MQVPGEASPKLAQKIERILQAAATHGAVNTYYLHNASCIFHLTNDPAMGLIQFELEGTIFTDGLDEKAVRADLSVRLDKETCDWLHQGIVPWLADSVKRAVLVEFDRYIAAGDLQRTRDRIALMEKSIDSQLGFVGMHL